MMAAFFRVIAAVILPSRRLFHQASATDWTAYRTATCLMPESLSRARASGLVVSPLPASAVGDPGRSPATRAS